jgi:arylsulfatase A-like enzyme
MQRLCVTILLVLICLLAASGEQATHPNILFIYADDLGYGDTAAYGATAVKTPNISRLAKEGLRFTSAYCTSATCTPSRYSLMTGQYAFRQKGTGVLPGDAALIIKPGRATLPSLLQKAGYVTGAVGKWHLGLGRVGETVDWNADIQLGPREVGFDYSFIMAATGDRVPCVYLENQRVVGLDTNDPLQVSYRQPFPGEPTGVAERDTLKLNWSHGHHDAVVNGIGRIGFMSGGKMARWKDEDMADTFTRKGVEFIERHRDKPFFLYFATHDIHVPRAPHPRFVGQTTMGPRGDVIVQFDWCVGELLATLDRLKLTENTLVILSSDNGPVLDDGYQDGAVEKLGSHQPAGPYRGGKYSIFEGGTRIPLIVRWPGRVKPGATDAMVSQVDFAASFAALSGQRPGPDDLPDSLNMLPAVLGDSKTGRDYVIEHANVLALRQGDWKYIEPGPGAKYSRETRTELGVDTVPQLYDLAHDPGEHQNLAPAHPERVEQMSKLLSQLRARGHSRTDSDTPSSRDTQSKTEGKS